ncbi:hypothetical protein [Chromohalobacter moromii]|uniref:Phage lysis regulatory protein, LysB family n=1 Tax=Chromohalobacter moromii TaxID=2860329 RepID=A0A9X2X3Y1_9GAMM|nr:hypothetical protein [Chromohalobacter moromii]MCT8506153.1 hypothetical protein [Chromohalobacter moromii]
MIARLLRMLPVWAWLLGAAGVGGLLGWWRLEAVIAERDLAEEQAEQAKQNVEQMQQALDWQRAQATALSVALAARSDALEQIRQDMTRQRQALDQLEANDADTRDWAGQPVPSAVAGWVRKLGASGRDGDDDADNTRTPDAPTPGAEPKHHEQP